MVDSRERSRLTTKSFDERWVAGQFLRKNLDGNSPVQVDLVGPVNGAHAALPNQRLDLKAGNAAPQLRGSKRLGSGLAASSMGTRIACHLNQAGRAKSGSQIVAKLRAAVLASCHR